MFNVFMMYCLLSSINEVYTSLYELIQSNDTLWENSCKTFQSTLDILNGTDNVTTPDLPGVYVCVCVCMYVCMYVHVNVYVYVHVCICAPVYV